MHPAPPSTCRPAYRGQHAARKPAFRCTSVHSRTCAQQQEQRRLGPLACRAGAAQKARLTSCQRAPRRWRLRPRCPRWRTRTGSQTSLQAAQPSGSCAVCVSAGWEGCPQVSCTSGRLPVLAAGCTISEPALYAMHISPAYLVPGSLGFTTWHDSPPPLVPACQER